MRLDQIEQDHRVQRESEYGSTTIEWSGTHVLVAVIIAALLFAGGLHNTAIGETIMCKIASAINATSGQSDSACDHNSKNQNEDTSTQNDKGANTNPPPSENDSTNNSGDVNQNKIDHAINTIREVGSHHSPFPLFPGVKSSDLDRMHQELKNLSGAELDRLFSSLSDEEIRRLMKTQDQGTLHLHGFGWPPEKRQEFLDDLARKASKDTVDRVAKYARPGPLPEIDQPPNGPKRKWKNIDGELYRGGGNPADSVSPDDIKQGSLGDCWLLASMMAAADGNPSSIVNSISRTDDGNYVVTLWHEGVPYKYVVTTEMVTGADGKPAYTTTPGAPPYELWPLVLEKAMAMHATKFANSDKGSFAKLNRGDPATAIKALTGKDVESQPIKNTSDAGTKIANATQSINQGKWAVASTENPLTNGQKETNPYYLPGGPLGNTPLIRGHAYAIVDADPQKGTLTLQNPHGPDRPKITLTYKQAEEALGWITVAP